MLRHKTFLIGLLITLCVLVGTPNAFAQRCVYQSRFVDANSVVNINASLGQDVWVTVKNLDIFSAHVLLQSSYSPDEVADIGPQLSHTFSLAVFGAEPLPWSISVGSSRAIWLVIETDYCPCTPPTCFPGQVVGPVDPNEKAGSQGIGAAQYISGQTPLRYAVFFGNEENASAPAQKVVVTDQLNASTEDLTTFNLGPISLSNQLVLPSPGLGDFSKTVDLRPSNNILVAVSAHLDVSTRLLTWVFQSLDPATNQPPTDPLAGFLPAGAGGSTFFTVMPKQALPTNTQVQNQATVVFDTNPPINTPTWTNTLDNTSPTSQVSSLPGTEFSLSFPVTWSGTDVGAGIQDFTVYVSNNGGPFATFQTNTPATSATFTGQVGHIYKFYSIARDLVGNVEGAKTTAEATTQVATDTTPPVTTAVASPASNAAGWNNSNVMISLNSTDSEPGGTGVKQIQWALAGAQTGSSTIPGGTTTLTISAEGTTTLSYFGADNAGNQETPKTLTIQIDKTPPSISGTRTPAANANGWNNSPVTVGFQCGDALSGLAPAGPRATTTLSTEEANQSVSGTCQDLAGNSASATVSGINIDKTSPVITVSANPPTLWPPNGKPVSVTVSGTMSDNLSGINPTRSKA